MDAGGMDVFEVVFVALVADRAKTLVPDHFGKTDDGIERRADFMTDFRQKL